MRSSSSQGREFGFSFGSLGLGKDGEIVEMEKNRE